MKLSAKAVAAARFTDRPMKLADGGGLTLHVTRTARSWRYRYRLDGKPREYTIGNADSVTLAEARELHRTARKLVAAGGDPVANRRQDAGAARDAEFRRAVAVRTTGQAVDDWLDRRSREWASSNTTKVMSRLKNLPPDFRARPVMDTTADDVLDVLQAAEQHRSADLAHRLRQYLAAVFDECIADELVTANPVRHPKITVRLSKRPPQKRYPHIRDARIFADVLARIEGYVGDRNVTAALWVLPRVFCRPSELRTLQWADVDIDAALIRIPGARMKAGADHLIPLAPDVLDMIESQRRWTEHTGFVFPGRSQTKPVSPPVFQNAMKRLGITSDVLVPHGFRHTASSFLNEREFVMVGESIRFSADAIEAQLAHATPGVRGRYKTTDHLQERRQMMAAWSRWCAELAAS